MVTAYFIPLNIELRIELSTELRIERRDTGLFY